MNFDSITKTEKPQQIRSMAPMWDMDGLRLPSCQEAQADKIHFSAYDSAKPIPQYANGRVIGVFNLHGNGFEMFTKDGNDDDSYKSSILYGQLEISPLSQVFFSNVNISRVQDLMRYRVWSASGGKYQIGPQSVTELIVIMRAMYLQHGKFLPYQIPEQITELNRLVVEFALPKLLSEVQQLISYQKNLEYLPVPLAHPRNLSSKGTRTLRSVTTTF